MADVIPLFSSVEGALMWAWYYSRHESSAIAGPSFGRFIKRDEREQIDEAPHLASASYFRTDRKPAGLDAAAQAGLIISYIEGMPGMERAHLKARMLRARDRSQAIRELVHFVGNMLADTHPNSGLLYELISKHYGRRGITMSALAKKYKLDRRKVTAIRRQIEITLDAISYRAETSAYERLQTMGVVA